MNNFLSTVLPTQGLYCAFNAYQKSKIRQTFHQSIDEVQDVGEHNDKAGWDSYFALATFRTEEGGRKQANAAFLRSFFLELDCGPTKPYADQTAAATALRKFVDAAKLPIPTIVGSGGGLHVYWVMDHDMPVAEWTPIAFALKAMCLREGLHIDPVISADSARVLRIPGTHNHKQQDNPRPVVIMRQGQPNTVAAFKALMHMTAVDFSSVITLGADEATNDLAGDTEYPVCNFTKIAKRSLKGSGCAQIAHILNNAATLEEPLWRAGLSIAVVCEDGETAIQKMSKGHPGYDPVDTAVKAKATKGPYTCEWFRGNYPDTCDGCKHKITSPIALGRIVEEAEAVDGAYVVEAMLPSAVVGAISTVVTVSIPKYPFPYFRGANGGVFVKSKDKDGEEVELEVYAQDLYITARFYDLDENGDGDGEMVDVNVHLDHDGIRVFHVPITTLFSLDKLRDALVKHGVIAYGKQLQLIMNYFSSTIKQLQSNFAASRTRNQMGWTPDMQGFVVGEIEYTMAGTRLAPPASGTRQLAAAFQQKGTLAEWKSMIDYYNTPGMESRAFATFFGFGSPLLKLIGGASVKGALVNLMSNESGTGKTTAQMVINSIFGHPMELMLGREDTTASKYHRLGLMNNICNTVDEITNMLDTELSEWSYGVTAGRGRHRMDSQANKLRVNNTTWCSITVTSSNSSVIDKLSQLKATADGELRRVLELYISPGSPTAKAESDILFGKLEHNYGIAGPIFIQYVLTHREEVTKMLKDMQLRIDADLNLTQSDRFLSCILACAFVGAGIAHTLGLHSIDIPRIYKHALTVVAQSKSQVSSSTGDALTIAKEALTAFANENINGILVINSIGKGGVPSAPIRDIKGNQLRIRYEPDRQELWVVSSDFKRYLHSKQIDVQRSLTALVTANIMKHNGAEKSKRIGIGAVVGVPALPTRCFCFDGAAIGLDADTFPEA